MSCDQSINFSGLRVKFSKAVWIFKFLFLLVFMNISYISDLLARGNTKPDTTPKFLIFFEFLTNRFLRISKQLFFEISVIGSEKN